MNTETAPLETESTAVVDVPSSILGETGQLTSAELLIDVAEVEKKVIAAIKTVFDPEIPLNVYDLGLIYRLEVEPTGDTSIRMTLTSPMCPSAGTLPLEVQEKAKAVPGVRTVKFELVWDPPFSPDMMSEAAKLQLGIFD